MRHPFLVPTGLTILAVLLHTMVQKNLVSLLPLPVFLSTLLVWLLPAPGYFLIVLAVAGELLSGLPPGIMTLIVVTPNLIFHWRGYIQADVSFSFFLLLLATFTLQLGALALAHLWPIFSGNNTWQQLVQVLPWQLIAFMVLLNTTAAWIVCVATQRLSPPDYHSSSLFDRQRYGKSDHR